MAQRINPALSEMEVSHVTAMLRRALARLENVFSAEEPDRLLRAAQRACRRAEARIEHLRCRLEGRP